MVEHSPKILTSMEKATSSWIFFNQTYVRVPQETAQTAAVLRFYFSELF